VEDYSKANNMNIKKWQISEFSQMLTFLLPIRGPILIYTTRGLFKVDGCFSRQFLDVHYIRIIAKNMDDPYCVYLYSVLIYHTIQFTIIRLCLLQQVAIDFEEYAYYSMMNLATYTCTLFCQILMKDLKNLRKF